MTGSAASRVKQAAERRLCVHQGGAHRLNLVHGGRVDVVLRGVVRSAPGEHTTGGRVGSQTRGVAAGAQNSKSLAPSRVGPQVRTRGRAHALHSPGLPKHVEAAH